MVWGADILDRGKEVLFAAFDQAIGTVLSGTLQDLYGSLYRGLEWHTEPELKGFRDLLVEHASLRAHSRLGREMFGRKLETKIDVSKLQYGTRSELAKVLSITDDQVKRIAGPYTCDRVPGSRHKSQRSFDIYGASNFVSQIYCSPTYNHVPPGLIGLLEVKRIGLRWPDVYRQIRDGRIPIAGRIAEQEGLPAVLVDRSIAADICLSVETSD